MKNDTKKENEDVSKKEKKSGASDKSKKKISRVITMRIFLAEAFEVQ